MTLRVQFCTHHHPRLFLRQTPHGDGVWHDLQFVLEDGEPEANWLVVFDEPAEEIRTRVPRERRILFVTEPPSIKKYRPNYLKQFAVAISPIALDGFDGIWIQRHGSLPWHFGVKWSTDQSETISVPFSSLDGTDRTDKQFELSVICSAKTLSIEHNRRLLFVSKLKSLLGERLHWYGRGVRDLEDKADAIRPYRYHIVLENNFLDHFWTEKIADAYLGLAFPFYSGCTNLGEYFDHEAFEYIDIDDPVGTAEKIDGVLASNAFENKLANLKEARRKVMFEYNLFNEVRNAILALQTLRGSPSLEVPTKIYPRKRSRSRLNKAVRYLRKNLYGKRVKPLFPLGETGEKGW